MDSRREGRQGPWDVHVNLLSKCRTSRAVPETPSESVTIPKATGWRCSRKLLVALTWLALQ